MNAKNINVCVTGAIGSIQLHRPGRHNALSRDLVREIQKALSDLHQQVSVRAVAITGGETVFCAGMDLHEIHETAQQPEAEQVWHRDADEFRQLLSDMLAYPKPIIGAVEGNVFGGGVGLLLASDVVVATRRCELAIPAPQRGLVAGLIAPLFAFRASAGWASRFMLTGERISAQTAHRIGIVHDVVEDGVQLTNHVRQLGERIEKGSFESIAMTKRLINEEIGEALRTQLAVGAAMTATSKATRSGRERVKAFVEKRTQVTD